MSAIVPEFLNFIKNLEENRDTLSPTTTGAPSWPHPQQIAEFEFNNSVCFVCNGYYGPNFGEPVCVTCHSFLFPEIPSVLTVYNFLGDKTDDGDSGNDEPSDLNYKFEWQGDRMKVEFPSRLLREMHELHEQQARRILEGDPDSDDESNEANNQPSGSGTNKNNKHIVPKQRAKKVGQAPPDPVPTLAKSLHALTTPRLPDNLEPGLVEQLPSEVLLCIFSYLDDLSLSECACVCLRWSGLVAAHVPPHRWASFTAHRWPMFKPVLASVDWSKKYRALVESSCCRNCLVQMCVQAKPVENDGRWRWNRLRSELKMLRNDPPEGIAATPIDVNCCHWQASVTGPVGSPYEGGLFYLYIQVPYTYPMSPPVVRFITRILHPNVSRHGDIGIDSVHHNWTLALTISKVIISVQSLLTDPYTGVCMEPELGRMYVQERSRFEELARQWTWRYAMHDVLP